MPSVFVWVLFAPDFANDELVEMIIKTAAKNKDFIETSSQTI